MENLLYLIYNFFYQQSYMIQALSLGFILFYQDE